MRVVYHAIAAPLGASLVPATRGAAHLWVRPPMGSLDAGNGTPRRQPTVSTLARPNGAGPAGGWRMERSRLCAALVSCAVPAGGGSWRARVAINPPNRQCTVHGVQCRFRLCLPTCAQGRYVRRVPRDRGTTRRVSRAGNSGSRAPLGPATHGKPRRRQRNAKAAADGFDACTAEWRRPCGWLACGAVWPMCNINLPCRFHWWRHLVGSVTMGPPDRRHTL